MRAPCAPRLGGARHIRRPGPAIRGGSRRSLQCVAFQDWFAKHRSTSSSSPSVTPSKSGSGSKRDFLEARQLSLFELFDGDTFRFNIPDYQRPYQWRSKQVSLAHAARMTARPMRRPCGAPMRLLQQHLHPACTRSYPNHHPQVFELLNDLQTAFQNGQEYFLGAIVTTKPEDGVCAPYQVTHGAHTQGRQMRALQHPASWQAARVHV